MLKDGPTLIIAADNICAVMTKTVIYCNRLSPSAELKFIWVTVNLNVLPNISTALNQLGVSFCYVAHWCNRSVITTYLRMLIITLFVFIVPFSLLNYNNWINVMS